MDTGKPSDFGTTFIIAFAALTWPCQWIANRWFAHTIMLYIVPFWVGAALVLTFVVRRNR